MACLVVYVTFVGRKSRNKKREIFRKSKCMKEFIDFLVARLVARLSAAAAVPQE